MRVAIAVVGLLILAAGAGGVVMGLGLLDDNGSVEVPPVPDAGGPAKKVSGRAGGRVEVGPVEAGRGTVVLRVRPPGQSSVRITAIGSDFKEEWNSTGALELVGLPAGKYKTKVTPAAGGSAARATFEVKDGQACELTFDTNKGGEWAEGNCGDAK